MRKYEHQFDHSNVNNVQKGMLLRSKYMIRHS